MVPHVPPLCCGAGPCPALHKSPNSGTVMAKCPRGKDWFVLLFHMTTVPGPPPKEQQQPLTATDSSQCLVSPGLSSTFGVTARSLCAHSPTLCTQPSAAPAHHLPHTPRPARTPHSWPTPSWTPSWSTAGPSCRPRAPRRPSYPPHPTTAKTCSPLACHPRSLLIPHLQNVLEQDRHKRLGAPVLLQRYP